MFRLIKYSSPFQININVRYAEMYFIAEKNILFAVNLVVGVNITKEVKNDRVRNQRKQRGNRV